MQKLFDLSGDIMKNRNHNQEFDKGEVHISSVAFFILKTIH